MNELNFGEAILQAAQSAITKFFAAGEWFRIDWGKQLVIDSKDLRQVFNYVDMGRVRELVLGKVEQKIADAIIQSMTTELNNDIKQIMCNPELREDLRNTIRTRIRESRDAVKKSE